MGRLEAVERAMGLMAGYGMQLWPILQDMSQLKELYGARANTFVANAGVLQTFGVNDFETARWLSQSMGKETIGYQTESYRPGARYARHIEQELDKTIGRILDRLDVQHSNFEIDRRDTRFLLDELVQQEENVLQRLRADQEKTYSIHSILWAGPSAWRGYCLASALGR